MRNISNKTDGSGDILSADAFNVNFVDEIQKVILDSGFTLDPEAGPDTDTEMLSKSIVAHALASQYFIDSGSADNYVLTRNGVFQPMPAYYDGSVIFFRPANDNTGASTINVDSLGVKDLVAADNGALVGGEIVTTSFIFAAYDSSDDNFKIVYSGVGDVSTLGGHPASYFAIASDVVNEVDIINDLRSINGGNQPIYVRGHTTVGDYGGDIFEWFDGAAPGTYVDDNGNTIVPAGGDGSGAWIRQYNGYIIPEFYGAVGDGITDDTAAIQAALDNNKTILLLEKTYAVTTISLDTEQTIIGTNRDTSEILGDGSGYCIVFGDGVDSAKRRNKIEKIKVTNDGNGCVDITFSPNWQILNCDIRATTVTTTPTIRVYNGSFRGALELSEVRSGGGAWAVDCLDNINGLTIRKNIITGGSAGGAVRVGQSQDILINNNLIETSDLGIYVAATTTTGDGNCNGIQVDNNYIEAVNNPINLAEEFSIYGASCRNNYINSNASASSDANIVFGRIQGVNIKNNSIYVNASGLDYPFRMHVKQATGDILDNTIINNQIFGTPAASYTTSGTYGSNASVRRTIGWQNDFQFLSSVATDIKEYRSPLITENVGKTNCQWATVPASFGGKIIDVKIIEISGTLTNAVLNIGRLANITDLLSYTILSSEKITNSDVIDVLNSGTVTINSTSATVRPDSARDDLFRVVAGTGTGTFRLYIRYTVS